jgi:hypothetical protein
MTELDEEENPNKQKNHHPNKFQKKIKKNQSEVK